MELTGIQQIRRDRAGVWAALNDPDVLRQCIPGCESMTREGDAAYAVVMTAAVGPVKARFNGKLTLSDVCEEKSYVLNFEGSGGAAGFGKGGATVTLAQQDSATLLTYKANARVGGKLAQVGSRLIDGMAAKMAADFFDRFRSLVEQPVPEEVAAAHVQAAPAGPAPARAEGPGPGRNLTLAIAAATVVIAIAWYFLQGT